MSHPQSEKPGGCSSPILQALLQTWQRANWDDLHLVVALSGGADSVALLRGMEEIRRQRPGKGSVFAVHVNHQLRGRDSQEDAQWCERLCDSLGIPLKVYSSDVERLAQLQGDGLEAAARAERLRLLTQGAEHVGARYLATAHTQDDQVETILFRILRGTGLRGLGGMPRMRGLSRSVTLVRPLLGCTRQMVLEYLDERGQSYRTDQSNFEARYSRNRLRHGLLPQLRQDYNPEIDAVLLRLAEQAEAAHRVVEHAARRLLAEAQLERRTGGNRQELVIGFPDLEGTDSALLAEALRIVWRESQLAEQAMTYQWWQRLAALARGDQQQSLNLPGDVQASIVDGCLVLRW